MGLITLTTDYGVKDHYVASIKGVIYSSITDAQIVDISHQIDKYNIQDAAMVLMNSYNYFPKKTVHLVAVFDQSKSNLPFVMMEHNDHYFIGPDNGVFTLMFLESPKRIFAIKGDLLVKSTFPVIDILTKAAIQLANGETMENIGTPIETLNRRTMYLPSLMGNRLVGSILYVDDFGNVHTNIEKTYFERSRMNRSFLIEIAIKYQIKKISTYYTDVIEGEILALFNSSSVLEIAMRNAKVNTMLNLKLSDTITIVFE